MSETPKRQETYLDRGTERIKPGETAAAVRYMDHLETALAAAVHTHEQMLQRNRDTLADMKRVDTALHESLEREKVLRDALARIERWFGEFPPSGRFWSKENGGEEMSYGAAFGSNGERDYMRGIARAALAGKVE